MRIIILMVVFIGGMMTTINAQDGYVHIHKDNRIDQLLSLYSQQKNTLTEAQGFRIQVLASTNRDKSYETQNKVRYSYGQYRTYLTYKSPYFKLRVGDFTDKLVAYRFLQQIRDKFPGSFMVEEAVNLN